MSSYRLIQQLHAHRNLGAQLRAAWLKAPDKEAALACRAKERDDWTPALFELIQKVDPALMARYDQLGPLEQKCRDIFEEWGPGDMVGAFVTLSERVQRLESDVIDLAQAYKVDLSQPIAPVKLGKKELESAYAERVRATRASKGRAPTAWEDETWRYSVGISRPRLRALRRANPAKNKPGNPKLAKK